MDAKQMLLDYAAKNNHHRNSASPLTDEQFLGKAMIEGVRVDSSGADIVAARIRREGKTIILTETTTIDGINGKERATVEIFRVDV